MTISHIELEGVRVHNLRDVNVRIRRNALTVICGVSGSGKSSLAFDTLFAEGQRRYIETFSASARQFLDRIERPAADRIDGIPPAIAIRQNQRRAGSRSTVGTRTEILDYLRMLLVRLGQVFCPECRIPVHANSPDTAAGELTREFPAARAIVTFPFLVEGPIPRDTLLERGFSRVIAAEQTSRVEDIDWDSLAGKPVDVVVDRIRLADEAHGRVAESMEAAFREGDGHCRVLVEQRSQGVPPQDSAKYQTVDDRAFLVRSLSGRLQCSGCGRVLSTPTMELLNFNSAFGACPVCEGTGSVSSEPLRSGGRKKTPRSISHTKCVACDGTRLAQDALAVQLNGQHLGELTSQSIDDLLATLTQRQKELPVDERQALHTIFEHALRRLQFLSDCGLGYLALERRI
ncbi:MAG: hypothetical protein KDA85_17720, partial [Planctomycetaceae bacterium]|nr:hypothetical protein [Planctomycetaceae bacterium]